jgi:hypothetical protein
MAKSSTRDGRVKTWKILKNEVRVGNSLRGFGDFLPEAPGLDTFASLLRADFIEEIWVDQEEFDEWEEDQKKRDAALLAGHVVEEDDEDDEDEVDVLDDPPPAPKVKKKAVKKSPARKTVKKGKSNVLAERSV